MNDGLIDAFRHNAWATGELLATCTNLTDAQLRATAPGTYGSVIDTLRHMVLGDARYLARLTDQERPDASIVESLGIQQFAAHADKLAANWERFLEQPFDAERTHIAPWDDGFDYDVPAGIVLAQALHHANEHRAHVCTVLSSIGVALPALSVWDFAEATHRAKPRGA